MINNKKPDCRIASITDQELHVRWFSEAWLIDETSLGALTNAVYLAAPRDLSTYPEKHQKEAKRRLHYIHSVQAAASSYNPKRWRARIAEAARQINDHPPCPATVQAWWRRFRHTKSVLSLIPHNKPSSGPKAKERYQIFEEVIATVYLTNQKLPEIAVVEEVFRRIDAINHGLPETEQIKRPARSTIYRWLQNLQQDLVDSSREGAEAARIKYRAALGRCSILFPSLAYLISVP